jgi:hypothetical protein
MMRGSPKQAASGPPRWWSAIITTIIIAASPFGWDRGTTGIITIIITTIIIADIDTKHWASDPDAQSFLAAGRPSRSVLIGRTGKSDCSQPHLAAGGVSYVIFRPA